MAEAAASRLPPKQKAQLEEVAALMLKVYENFADMRYLDPRGIVRGPHKIDQELLAEYTKHNLDPAIIYLYSILPYIDEHEADAKDFFHGSSFADFRKAEDVERGRDPLYCSPNGDFDDEDGEYMRSWYTPLSQMGNHESVIIYDAREHRIWVIDQCGQSTTDPGLVPSWHPQEPKEESNWGDSEGSSYEEEDDDDNDETDSHGSSEFWDSDDQLEENEVAGLQTPEEEQVDFDEGFELVENEGVEQPKNRNSIEHIRCRPAGVFLRDLKRWYVELKELPGKGEYSHHDIWSLSDEVTRSLYLKNGWPDNFDGEQFEVDGARAYCAKRAQYDAENPSRQVQCYEGWLEYPDRDIERHNQEIADAKTPDEEWLARFQIWQAEERRDRNLKDLANARANAQRLFPDGKCQQEADLPLWEAEKCRVELQWKRERISRDGDGAQQATNESDRRYHEIRQRHAKKSFEVYSKAYEASKADAERLCPGRTFADIGWEKKTLGRQSTTDQIRSQEKSIVKAREGLKRLQEWKTRLPTDVDIPETRKALEREIEQHIQWEKSAIDRKERSEKWLAEHGDTD